MSAFITFMQQRVIKYQIYISLDMSYYQTCFFMFIFQKQSMKKIVIIALLIQSVLLVQVQPPQLFSEFVVDEPQQIRLAQQQKFVIPLNGRTISHSIQYFPENHGQCQFVQPSINYKEIAESQTIFQEGQSMMAILPLMEHKLVYVADPFYNVVVYSIDQHSLLKKVAPKKSLKPGRFDHDVIEPILFADQFQNTVFFVTPKEGFSTDSTALFSHIEHFELQGNLKSLLKGEQIQSYVIIACKLTGLHVYKIQTKTLRHVQSVQKGIQNQGLIDIQLCSQKKILYALYDDKIQVYSVNLPNFYEASMDQSNILILYDKIELQRITFNHNNIQQPSIQNSFNKNLEISRNREQQTLMILFRHNGRSVVAQLSYSPREKKFIFLRYYKFIMELNEIHLIDDLMIVVGQESLGMFPYGIDPRLIQEEFNGFMTLSPIKRLVITENPFFIGITKYTIEYGGIFFSKTAGLTCHINQTSTLKSVKFKANLTTCEEQASPSFKRYCQYEKTFVIEQMQLAISAPVADSLWIAMIAFVVLMVLGICLMFTYILCYCRINKRKQQEIKKLELYFEQKRRTQVPPSSDRDGAGLM